MTAEMNFSVSGKCILAGEHSVLRGSPALVVPFAARRMELSYLQGTRGLRVETAMPEMELLFSAVLERALQALGRQRAEVTGRFLIKNSIPIGAGLGFSAALCVALSRWLVTQGWLNSSEAPDFARRLEDLFHGESSGLDVAVAWQNVPLRFVRGEDPRPFEIHWQPHIFVSYSGQRGLTSECVQKVQAFTRNYPDISLRVDQDMSEAVSLTERALSQIDLDENERGRLLRDAFHLGRSCFAKWGLTEGMLAQHLDSLERVGAWAVKPTGSGGGGHALSFWQEAPTSEVRAQLGLLPLFETASQDRSRPK